MSRDGEAALLRRWAPTLNLQTTKPLKGPDPTPFIYSTGWKQASLPNAQGGRYALVATYSSYLNSAQSFAAIDGKFFNGVTDTTSFGTIAQAHGFGINLGTFVSIANTFVNCLK